MASLVRLIADRAADPARHKVKVCLLLGAGADISSGGISFVDLKRYAVEDFLKTPLFDVTLPEEIEARFERLFLTLPPDERALLVEAIFRRAQSLRPSDAYKLLVLLAEAGGIDAVVTTNFDLTLEQAQYELGRDLFQVFAPGLARPYVLGNAGFDLPKKPYLKLHGDIGSRSIFLLTTAELMHASYDESTLQLLVSILRTHDLVLAGYSGFDDALAQIIAEAIKKTDNRVFWCNPKPPSLQSPLYSRISSRVRFIQTGFDNLMREVARPILEKPSIIATEPTYVRCLFDWRLDYCNREYVHAYGERSGKRIVNTFARRRTIEERLTSFLQPNHPLAIIAGPSGFGKTTMGIRLYKTLGNQGSARVMLIRSRAVPDSGDIEQHVCEQLGGLGLRTPFSLFRLERWLKDNNLRLTLFIDGINEFSPELGRCLQFFRNILRFCYFLPESNSALRIIATVRQETWTAMLPHLDVAQLRATLWAEGDLQQSSSTITCGPFSDEELREALARLHNHGYASIDIDRLPPSFVDQLRDPYLLGVLAKYTHDRLPVSRAILYHQVFETKLEQSGSLIDIVTLKDVLASLAIKCLESQRDRFREIEVQPAAIRGDIIRLMKDLHIFIDAGQGFLQFDHDRTFEYFLALGLASNTPPSLETMDDLREYLRCFSTQSKAIAAARLYFQLAPADRFPLIASALHLLDDPGNCYIAIDRELLFGFAREVLIEMAEQGEELARQYLADAIEAARVGDIGSHQLRTVVQAVAALPVEDAIPLLTRVAHPLISLAQTESNIYAIDKLVKQYLSSGCTATDLLVDEPYAEFFVDSSITPWQRLGRLLSFAAQLGPDNTHPDEYASISRLLHAALDQFLMKERWGGTDASAIGQFFLQNCDRLLFNATPLGIASFFDNQRRGDFEAILDRLAVGQTLDEKDLLILEPYTQTLNADVEYHLSHLMFILSSLNDFDATLQLTEFHFATFSNDTPPEEIDFFHAVVVYLHVLHGHAYDQMRFSKWEEQVLHSWPDVLLYRPGLERGERRGFRDVFDRVFEDGFGVIYPYGILLPSLRRRRSSYKEYRRELAAEITSPLPLYTSYLDSFISSGRLEEALQLLHALSGVIVSWPLEGLLALRGIIGHPEPRVRRAIVRILAEAYNRHPDETMQFLRSSGVAVSDDDLVEIKVRQDARIGRRQISEQEWARIGHLLFARPAAKDTFISCIRALLRADSVDAAIIGILQALGRL